MIRTWFDQKYFIVVSILLEVLNFDTDEILGSLSMKKNKKNDACASPIIMSRSKIEETKCDGEDQINNTWKELNLLNKILEEGEEWQREYYTQWGWKKIYMSGIYLVYSVY